jgi:hypothetical protein
MAVSLTEFTTSFRQTFHGSMLDMYQAAEFPAKKLSCDLIVIGGPRGNPIYEVVNNHLGQPVRFQENSAILEDCSFESLIIDGELLRDYGFVTVARNPFNPERRVCMFAGIHSHGLQAAVSSMMMPVIREVIKKVGYLQDFLVVLEAYVVSNFVGRPTVVYFQKLRATERDSSIDRERPHRLISG